MQQRIVDAADLARLLYQFMPLEWLFSMARLQGRLRYRRRPEGRVVRDNLAQTFGATRPADEIDRLSRQFFEYERIRALLLALAPYMSDDALAARLRIEGEAHLDEALARGKGAILLGSHLNSVFMFLAIMMWRRRGYEIRVALPEAEDPWGRTLARSLMERVVGSRETIFAAIGGFHTQFNVRPIVQRLRQNQVIAQTGDGWHSARFVEVEFLGRRLPFTTGFWSIAQSTGAPVIPLFQPGAPPDGVRVVLEPPVILEQGADGEARLHEAIADYAKRLERHLLDCIPTWQHWLAPRALDMLAAWPERTLAERQRDVLKEPEGA